MEERADYNIHDHKQTDDWIIDELGNEKSLLVAEGAGRRGSPGRRYGPFQRARLLLQGDK